MITIHRVGSIFDSDGWCGKKLALGSDEGTSNTIDGRCVAAIRARMITFQVCGKCLDLHADVLPGGAPRPRLVHAARPVVPGPYPCGESLGYYSSAPDGPSDAQCARDQLFQLLSSGSQLVPCRRCAEIKFGGVRVPAQPAAAPKKPDDGFNGNCRACGSRTYEGATSSSFEHQGGPCEMELRR